MAYNPYQLKRTDSSLTVKNRLSFPNGTYVSNPSTASFGPLGTMGGNTPPPPPFQPGIIPRAAGRALTPITVGMSRLAGNIVKSLPTVGRQIARTYALPFNVASKVTNSPTFREYIGGFPNQAQGRSQSFEKTPSPVPGAKPKGTQKPSSFSATGGLPPDERPNQSPAAILQTFLAQNFLPDTVNPAFAGVLNSQLGGQYYDQNGVLGGSLGKGQSLDPYGRTLQETTMGGQYVLRHSDGSYAQYGASGQAWQVNKKTGVTEPAYGNKGRGGGGGGGSRTGWRQGGGKAKQAPQEQPLADGFGLVHYGNWNV